jgi:hypothetical protein
MREEKMSEMILDIARELRRMPLKERIEEVEQLTAEAILDIERKARDLGETPEKRLAVLRDRLSSGELARLNTLENIEYGKAQVVCANEALGRIRELIAEVELETGGAQ